MLGPSADGGPGNQFVTKLLHCFFFSVATFRWRIIQSHITQRDTSCRFAIHEVKSDNAQLFFFFFVSFKTRSCNNMYSLTSLDFCRLVNNCRLRQFHGKLVFVATSLKKKKKVHESFRFFFPTPESWLSQENPN